tara:strand:- start:9377 stop:11623 length:2247 start_codon:yes stop_codon:yes gene_type:complete
MNSYNLDINKYNNTELENLLKLKKNYNIKDLDNAKNKILNNLSKKEGMEDKKASLELFLDNIYNKLSNKLKEIHNNNNNKLEQFDKHFIIQNHNKGYSILDNNQPIEKSIIKKTYNIDSLFRKNYLETSTNYTLDLPEKIQKVITMSISSINIPLTYFNISYYNKNNILSLYSINRESDDERVGEFLIDISLNNGIYTNDNIIEEIQNTINTTDLSNVLQCGIDKTSGLVYFVLSPILKLFRPSSITNQNTITGDNNRVGLIITISTNDVSTANDVNQLLVGKKIIESNLSATAELGVQILDTPSITISETSVLLNVLVSGVDIESTKTKLNTKITTIITESSIVINIVSIAESTTVDLQIGDTFNSGSLHNQSSIMESTNSNPINNNNNNNIPGASVVGSGTTIYGVLADKNNQNFKIRYTEQEIMNSRLLKAIYMNNNGQILDDYDTIDNKEVIGFYIKLNYSDHSFERLNCSESNNNCSARKEIYDDRRIIQQKQLSHMLGLQTDEDLFENTEIKKKEFKRISVTKPDDWIYNGTSAIVSPPIDITYKDMMFHNQTGNQSVNDIRHLELRLASSTGPIPSSIGQDDHLTGHGINVEDYNSSNQHKYTIPDPYDIYTARKLGINNENLATLPCYISYPKYVYIAIDDFQANSKNYFTLATESLLSPNIIARINISTLLEEKKKNNNNGMNTGAAIDYLTNQKNIREYFGPTNINRLKISLIDEYGELLNLNDRDWSFLLTFECLYN